MIHEIMRVLTCHFLFMKTFLNFLIISSSLYEMKTVSSNQYIPGKSLKHCIVPKLEKTSYTLAACSSGNCYLKTGQSVAGNGTAVDVKCLEQYTLENEDLSLVVCFDGDWYPKKTICVNTCKSLYHKYALHANCTYKGSPVSCEAKIKVGTEAILYCEKGYSTNETLQNDICLANGDWSFSSQRRFRCIPKTCEPLVPENADNTSLKCWYNRESVSCKDTVKVGTTATWQCKTGYFKEMESVMCQPSGDWSSTSGNLQHCTQKTCEPLALENADNIRCKYNDQPVPCNATAKVGTIVTWRCKAGYSKICLQSDACQENGFWQSSSKNLHHCTGNTCQALNLKNAIDANCTYEGRPVSCEYNVKVGTKAMWQCDMGYSTNRALEYEICHETGIWSSSLHGLNHCIPRYCEPLAVKNSIGSSCSYFKRSVPCNVQARVGTIASWQCKTGYYGAFKYDYCLDAEVWWSSFNKLQHCIRIEVNEKEEM